MNRRVLVSAMIAMPFLVAFFLWQLPVGAAPTGQLIRDTRPTPIPNEPLTQPITVQIRQLLPVTLTLGGGEEETTTGLSQTLPVTLDLDLRLALTQTLTSTVASTVTLVLTLPDGVTLTVPLSLSLGTPPSATVVVTPLILLITETTATPTEEATPEEQTPTATPTEEAATATPTATLTPTVEVTPTLVATPTAATTPTLPAISSTVNITANLRAGPGVTFDVVAQGGLGQPVIVTAVSADGAWYLLNNGAWIAVGLLDNAPANPPVASEPLIAAVQATATANASVVTTPTVAATPTPGTILLPTPTATPAPQPATVTVDANLRSGPGLEFPLLGGTQTGQVINIVARNEAGDWFLLDNGGWVASFLVANAPDLATVPIFNPNQPPATAPVTTTVPVTATAPVTATTPATATTPTTPTTGVTLGIRDNLYLVDANELLARYDRALGSIDGLLAQAAQNEALLLDDQWVQAMTTAIALLRATDTRVRSLEPTPLLAPAHEALVAASNAYDAAATLLAQGVDQQAPALFDQAFVEINRGNASLDSAADQIEALSP